MLIMARWWAVPDIKGGMRELQGLTVLALLRCRAVQPISGRRVGQDFSSRRHWRHKRAEIAPKKGRRQSTYDDVISKGALIFLSEDRFMPESIKLDNDHYQETANIIACIIYSMASTDMGNGSQPAYWHGCENNMHAPCDMLARLSILSGQRGDMLHHFTVDWIPGTALPVCRHAAEPSAADLAIALHFYADWFPGALRSYRPRPSETMPPHFDMSVSGRTAPRVTFQDWAVRRAGAWLLEHDHAIWFQGEGLCFDRQFEEHKILDVYWQNRFEMKQSYGNSEQALFPLPNKDWSPK